MIAMKQVVLRLLLFRGESHSDVDYLNMDVDSANFALRQRLKGSRFWEINRPVGFYNAGNICYIVSQFIF